MRESRDSDALLSYGFYPASCPLALLEIPLGCFGAVVLASFMLYVEDEVSIDFEECIGSRILNFSSLSLTYLMGSITSIYCSCFLPGQKLMNHSPRKGCCFPNPLMSELQELKDSAARIDIFWSGSSETVEQAKTDHQKGCADADGVSELHAAVFFPHPFCVSS